MTKQTWWQKLGISDAEQDAAALETAKNQLREGHGREHIYPPLQSSDPKRVWDQAEAEVARERLPWWKRL